MFLACLQSLKKRERKFPADDIGMIYMLILVFYGTFPPLLWVLQGGEYTSIFSGRLLNYQPSTADVFTLSFIVLGYAVGFSSIYLNFHNRIPIQDKLSIVFIKNKYLIASIYIVICSVFFSLYLSSSNTIERADSYIDQYRVIQELPLLLRQLIKMFGGISAVAKLVVMVALLQRWPKNKILFYFYIGSVLLSFDAEGSRAAVVTGLFSVLLGWHILVSPISSFKWLSIGFFGFILFLALGVLRGVESGAGILLTLNFNDFSFGELDSIWANGVELLQESRNGQVEIPFHIFFGEFYSFIPSQLLPFEKSTFSDWYLSRFHAEYRDQGGGWVFGAIPQAVVGGGALDALVRGGILGGLAVWLMRWYRSQNALWWYLPAYLFLLINVFQVMRDTTFRLFGDFVQIVFPAILLIIFLSYFFENKKIN